MEIALVHGIHLPLLILLHSVPHALPHRLVTTTEARGSQDTEVRVNSSAKLTT